MEFKLSDKKKGVITASGNREAIYIDKFKEFIRLLKERLYSDWESGTIGLIEYYRRLEAIDELAGDI